MRGYVLDDVRLKNGAYLSKQYFRDLILEIRDIRESERNFYQQITDIYATALDYDLQSPTTVRFFATVQNKLHFATHGQTEKGIPMTMNDWSEKLNAFLKFNDAEILQNAGKVTAEVAKSFAESEFEKYRPIQDRLFVSDFDREIKKLIRNKGLKE